MSLHPDEIPFFRLRVLGFMVDTGKKLKARDKIPEKKTRSARQGRAGKSVSAWTDLFTRIMRSFRCKRFVCNVDTDDVVLNAQLFPVGYFISRGPAVINVNFERKYLLDIWIRVYVHRMLWAFIRFYLNK